MKFPDFDHSPATISHLQIKAVDNSIVFLLVDEETDRHYRNKKMKLGAGLATTRYLPHKPRIVDMTKGSDGYGYYLRSYPKLKGVCVTEGSSSTLINTESLTWTCVKMPW